MGASIGSRTVTRWKAAAIHLVVSALVAALALGAIFFLWYPGALFQAAGGRQLFLLISGVDIAIGPLITLIIFVQGKKGLKFDLATIAVLQLAALSYGAYVLFESRPAWIVFVVDRFELVRANQILDAERAKAKPPFNELSLSGPRLAGARQPSDPNEQLRIAMGAAATGQDLQTYPQYFVAYDDVRRAVMSHAKPLARLRELNPGAGAQIDRLPSRLGRKEEGLGFLPLRAGRRDLTVIVDRSSGEFLETLTLRPWTY